MWDVEYIWNIFLNFYRMNSMNSIKAFFISSSKILLFYLLHHDHGFQWLCKFLLVKFEKISECLSICESSPSRLLPSIKFLTMGWNKHGLVPIQMHISANITWMYSQASVRMNGADEEAHMAITQNFSTPISYSIFRKSNLILSRKVHLTSSHFQSAWINNRKFCSSTR